MKWGQRRIIVVAVSASFIALSEMALKA